MKQRVLDIINSIRSFKGLPALETIHDSDILRHDLQLTSFDLAELTVKLEDEFDVDIFEDGMVNTVGDIYAKLSD
jgi:acyl carrier protein